jgi:hypothetical protein
LLSLLSKHRSFSGFAYIHTYTHLVFLFDECLESGSVILLFLAQKEVEVCSFCVRLLKGRKHRSPELDVTSEWPRQEPVED